MTPQELCNQAAAALQRGQPLDAERLAREALKLSPRDFAGLHLRAIAQYQLGKLPQALEAMRAAVQVNGAVAPAWNNLGSMQLAAGDMPGALASFERALALGPPQAELLCNIGNLLTEQGRVEDALQRYDAALTLNPRLAPALLGRANARQLVQRFTEALADCEQALQMLPGNPAALNNKAASLLGLHRYAEALDVVERSLAARPGSANALSNRASALLGLKRHAEALAACGQALALDPRHALALCNKGTALSGLGRQADALVSFDAALALEPQLGEALINRVTPLRHMERYDDALAGTERALANGSVTGELLRAHGIVLHDLGRQDEALASFDRAMALDDDDAEARFNKAQVLMQAGDFAAGLPLYEARKRLSPPIGAREFPQPLWLGAGDIAGKTIFVHPEQGLGDAIMFARLVTPLAARGARVILSVPDRLKALFQSFTPRVDITGYGAPRAFDLHLPLASLMLALNVTPDAVPAPDAYLAAEPARAARWRDRIGAEGFKIGIAWQGARVSNDIGRSFTLALFKDVAAQPGVRLISLQKGDGAEQLAALPPGMAVETLGDDFDSGPDAFLDTAAAMQACDLIITSDTAIAHLAGALGRPVWIALRHSPEWRWLLKRGDSPWYPSATLYRQPAPGNWTPVFDAMAQALRARKR